MKSSVLNWALSASTVVGYPTLSKPSSLVVTEAPQSLRPYVIRRGDGLTSSMGNQVYRFPVTGNSSGGAFTILQANAPNSASIGVLPHLHKLHYENFYVNKGRAQLWAQTADMDEQQTRVMQAGDYGCVPHNTKHAYQFEDPDTEFTVAIQPGGFEALFLAISGGEYKSIIGSEFITEQKNDSSTGVTPELAAMLEVYDSWIEPNFVPRQDSVNGIAGSGNWHNGSNELAADEFTPNFIAKNYGPKYLNSEGGIYTIIAPLATGKQTANNLTEGTMTLSKKLANQTAPVATVPVHTAFQMQEGQLLVTIGGESEFLETGDVVFVPGNTTFSYFSTVAFTQFLYVSAGVGGLDEQLLANSVDWDYATFPQYPPSN
ncbi:uncharacterized protein JN550_006484 [Neoarthrinium moseri]|uniref:uncharacterized protein n=1 Tax=Neoarthrinium moseri TaxID=1658444 RepID=UPI001FDC7314|nr:uncharacterized protein JN550_006484 [Neoarthrinium moseri]KAI1868568.1 hypothetical protein JN550_006484 [Neoarthrinium moseri]